jgi:ankyrin repeat protein
MRKYTKLNMDVCTNHINYICNNWSNLKYEPKLELNEIEKLTDNIIKIYLFCYYGYIDQLYKYDLLNLKMPINKNNDNLYLLASYCGHIKVMEYLENKGVDEKIKNNNGNNAYLFASWGGHIKVMEYLENKGFDITIKNKDGKDAYLLASYCGHIKVMEYLENKGFDITIKNNNGNNAYLLASWGGHIKVMEYLENKKYKKYITETHDDCIVCMSNDNGKYIRCKFMHDIHMECQKKSCKSYCLVCFTEY